MRNLKDNPHDILLYIATAGTILIPLWLLVVVVASYFR